MESNCGGGFNHTLHQSYNNDGSKKIGEYFCSKCAVVFKDPTVGPNVLEQALKIVKEREGKYGSPEETFQSVADAFSALTGTKIQSKDVALLQILLKMVRSKFSPENEDHYIDIAGYTNLLARIACKK